MTDGVGWAAIEIVLFLVVATLIGFAVGLILGRWLQSQKLAGVHEAEIAAQQELAKKAEHRLTQSNQQIDRLQLELKAKQERILHLETDVPFTHPVDVAAASAVIAAEEPSAAVPKSSDLPGKEEALARISEIAERTAGGEPIANDDLKLIHGIGPKLERILKDLGISSFRQIANFTGDDVADVTAALGAFKGRIERDDWMNSAAEQHMKKYNSPA